MIELKEESLIGRFKKWEEEKKEFKKALPYSLNYIEWLEEFTARYGHFSTDSFLYDFDLLSDKDKSNVGHLETLFEEIYDYAEENYIDHHKLPYGIFYSIKHNGVGYYIGVDYGQGCDFFCERLDKPDQDAIEYEHIMSSVKLPNAIFWDVKLDELVEVIERLSEEVPVEAIEKTAQDTIEKLKVKTKTKKTIS